MIFNFHIFLVSGLQSNPVSIGSHSKNSFFIFKRNFGFFGDFEAKYLQQIVENRFKFHQRESRSDAISWSDTERQISVGVDVFAVFIVKPFGIEFFWFWEVFWVMVEAVDGNLEVHVGRKLQRLVVEFQDVFFNAISIDQLCREKI